MYKISYQPLWNTLYRMGRNKNYLRNDLGLSSATLAKMSKGESVTLEVCLRISIFLSCRIEDIVEFVPEEKDT